MKKILLTTALFASLFIINAVSAKAQDSTAVSNVAVTIATVTELTADNNNLATFAFTNGSELETGITQTNAVTIGYKSNKVTKVLIKASTSTFSGGAGDMPVGVVSYKKNGAGSFVALTATDANLSTSQAKGSSSFGVDYKITPGLAYNPATDYAVTIEYTLTSQ